MKINENTLKVAIYVRVSTEEQAKEGLSIDAQIDKCQAFCHARDYNGLVCDSRNYIILVRFVQFLPGIIV